jgi:multiple PDZ domain protein
LGETVIVIKSLVPGGPAHVDGRIVPGDRLLWVNETSLTNASLEQAVQALKHAPAGPVVLGVAKPLPVDDGVRLEFLVLPRHGALSKLASCVRSQ